MLEAIAKVDRRAFISDKFVMFCAVDPEAAGMMQQALMMLDAKAQQKAKQGKSILILPDQESCQEKEDSSREDVQLPIHVMVSSALVIVQTARPIAISQKELAYNDMVLEIGYNQTCSQPSITAFLLDALELGKGMRVLEVGAGCGYSAAIASHIVGDSGYLVTIECLPPLAKLAKKNLENHFGIEGLEKRIKVIEGDGSLGYKEKAPYDRIYLTAGVDVNSFKPEILAKQLNLEKGILVFPEMQGNVIKQVYEKGNKVDEKKYFGVQFVPLRGENS